MLSITAALLVIGDEILSGRTKDKNIGYIAEYLTALGIDLLEVRIVGDREAEIVEAINTLRRRYSYLFTTGGIGPTHDDITADCVAKAFGVPIDVDPRALAILRQGWRLGSVGVGANLLLTYLILLAALRFVGISQAELSSAPAFAAFAIAFWAGRTHRAWLVPTAVFLALPVLWLQGLAILTASFPLYWERARWQRAIGSPGASPTIRQGIPA